MSIAAEQIVRHPSVKVRLGMQAEPAGKHEFFRFCFGKTPASTEPVASIPVPLPVVMSDVDCEIWDTQETAVSGHQGDILFAQTESLLMVHSSASVPPGADIADPTYTIYKQLLREAQQRGFSDIVRTWNYIPDINAGNEDAERYRQFSVGRAQALEELQFPQHALPAGTAIGGTADIPLGITLLAAKGSHPRIENPRQISAYEYPRQYGPKSPSFSRAVLLQQQTETLLVSGTASIIGHESVHTAHLNNQGVETGNNILSLRDAAAKASGKQSDPAYEPGVLRIYVRNSDDIEAAVASLRQLIEVGSAHADCIILHGDICRSDLLLEVEALYPVRQ